MTNIHKSGFVYIFPKIDIEETGGGGNTSRILMFIPCDVNQVSKEQVSKVACLQNLRGLISGVPLEMAVNGDR